MGSIHNELRSAVLQQAIRDAVGGGMEVEIERIGETITPILDLWSQPEWFQLRGVRRWSTSVVLAANVAGISRFQLRVPAGTGVIAVVEELNIIEATAATNYSLTDTGALIAAGEAPCTALDSRWQIAAGGGSRPTVILQTVDNTAAGLSGILLDTIAVPLGSGNPSFKAGLPFVLTPGNYIQIQSTNVNHACRFQARGYERLAFPGEL